jgi:hypothetical protein
MSQHYLDTAHPRIDRLEGQVSEARALVTAHPIYSTLENHRAILTFMEHHVFAVWDFMSLLKSLQRSLTCVDVPWIPTGQTASRRLINDIVVAEESDEVDLGFTSHFEWYLTSMREAGANTKAIEALIGLLRDGIPVRAALQRAGVPKAAADFVETTWTIIDSTPIHCQAAAFAFGREELIPEMFTRVVAVNNNSDRLNIFLDYLTRHIEVDDGQHTPMAMQMLIDLCGEDDDKWAACADTANTALAARARLWDGILEEIEITC